jgi:hypothetical protein
LRQIVRFFVLNHSSAVEFANRITCDRYLAETVVSQTYIELLQGRTTIALFYHALKMNARDALRLQQIERGRFESLDHMVAEDSSRKSAGYDSLGESERADFQSHRWDDQDPIDVLIQREDRAELDQMVQTTLKDPRWRYIKRLKWASPLAACAKKAGSFE